MQRDSDEPRARRDDEVQHELQDMERASRDRLEDWQQPSAGDPQPPEVWATGVEPQTVADVMTRPVVAVPVEAPVTLAAEAMRDKNVGDVLAVAGGRVRGIVTDRDLVVRVLADRADPTMTTVGEVCSAEVITARPDTPVHEAVELMQARAVRRLPIVDDEGLLQGVVSLGDLALAHDPRSALARISAAAPNT